MDQRGFSLLEIMVALAIMGLAMALVAPASFRMVAAWQESSDVSRILGRLAMLPLDARQAGQALHLDPSTPPERISSLLDLPQGWRLEFETELVVLANGACRGGKATLVTERQSIPVQIHAPFCRPERG
ncbi:prepilin-type N-terminal cleavage/methylation domain-containing protein [uncultured Luteimonas sp.]|uniref:prepilin-type N-terminal cleavage/methylation domain-containing protein n=1 Tax=uncultured Luteimonas sp. TaxID=453144 RepID=UPI0026027009|nr:prepilin-type N-terminal cleavage/methylation domain-containing protein [uncultured Luteimonas sp.]